MGNDSLLKIKTSENFVELPNQHISSLVTLPNIKNTIIIDFSNNNLSDLNGLPLELKQLHKIDIKNNVLQNLIDLPKSLPMIEIIDFSNNQLQSFKGLPKSMPNVTDLIFDNNELFNFDHFPSDLPKLEIIGLSENHFTSLDGFPSDLPNISIIYLAGNPLRSLHGIDRSLYKNIVIDYESMPLSDLGSELVYLCKSSIGYERACDDAYEYYKESPLELIQKTELDDWEIERICHEGGRAVRDVLNLNLYNDHPAKYCVKYIDKRLSISVNDQKLLL